MTDALTDLSEEIKFLDEEIRGFKARTTGSETQVHKLSMLTRLRERCERSKQAIERKAGQ